MLRKGDAHLSGYRSWCKGGGGRRGGAKEGQVEQLLSIEIKVCCSAGVVISCLKGSRRGSFAGNLSIIICNDTSM